MVAGRESALLTAGPSGGSTALSPTWEQGFGGFGISWGGGPHVIEVARMLERMANDDEVTSVLPPGDVTGVHRMALASCGAYQ
jgi:hypothetical protein